ncbi:MAG: GGDEF domain-containing protein [Gammaproteobacteria bacterium]|nr:GGDEF domain-containing protein [Gammaproteobacteria bacterium]
MFHRAFANEALQKEYHAGLASERVRLTRVGVALATLLNVSFASLDMWAVPSALVTVWSIRIVMNLILVVCLAATWHRAFDTVYPAVTATLFLTLGGGVNAMIYVADPADLAVDAYYGGLLLTTFGVYTLTYINFALSTSIALILITSYAAVSIYAHDFLRAEKFIVLMTNLFFFIGATVLGITAQGVRDRYTRENYLLRHSLERDVELKEEENKRASYLAEHDALTGLPNRLNFDKQATRIIDGAGDSGEVAVILFIDLNKFKPVNDNHGHAAGDRVLKVIAERLRSSLRKSDAIARFGGDEFVVCACVKGDVAPLTKKLIDAIEQPVEVRGTEIRLSASIGIALHTDAATTLEALISEADEDMYKRKQSGAHLFAARA